MVLHYFQRWNRLSRLQRSIVYAVVAIGATILVLLYVTKIAKMDAKKKIKSNAIQVRQCIIIQSEHIATY